MLIESFLGIRMVAERILYLVIFLTVTRWEMTLACTCDDSLSERRLLRSSIRQHRKDLMVSSFLPAKVKGMEYVRPAASSAPYTDLGPRGTAVAETDPNCVSDQVHIVLGNDLSSMIISYVSYSVNDTASIWYSENEDDLLTSAATEVTGISEAHSQIMYIITRLVEPTMGAPAATEEEIVKLQDTKSWAYDKQTGEHWANWFNITEMETGFGDYNNPYMVYDSPMLHSVEVFGLQPLTTYYYRVAGSCVIHQFTMPPFSYNSPVPDDELYPFTLGLVGDLGQTQVSVGSMEALADMESDAVLLVGDLSYAGIYLVVLFTLFCIYSSHHFDTMSNGRWLFPNMGYFRESDGNSGSFYPYNDYWWKSRSTKWGEFSTLSSPI